MRRILLLAAGLILGVISMARSQQDEYRNADNEMYWQHRKPYPGYWQQDVRYRIDASVDEVTHMISGNMQLDYRNNSPDTLHYVYFRLFQNAFVKGAHLRELERVNRVRRRMGAREAAGLGTLTNGILVNGRAVETELDNTILKVYLAEPLYPGKAAAITMDFQTWWDMGETRRRMKMYPAWGFMHYNGVQWFPKICVYDRKFGWENSQHLNKEFYADYGYYDVRLDFPSNYIVEATGELQNRAEMLPDTLREKLDIRHFASKPWGEPPSVIIPYRKGERKIWHFTANNVHDFAFTADPSYRIGTVWWNGVECVGLAQEPHASGWQNAAQYVADIIRTFSEEIGMYRYPKMVAADARDGMEYPMITLDAGSDPGYRGLLVHEIGHNWFYGMVGNNETYRAMLDEGFTQYLTAEGLRLIDGDTMVASLPRTWYGRKFSEPLLARERSVYNAFTVDALRQQGPPLNTHSNDFGDALHHENGYRQVYYKAAAMLYNLEYVLGDSLFRAALQDYFRRWSFAHPYPEDFRESIIRFTGVDLNWFFDQWIETTKTIDYKVTRIRRVPGTDSFFVRFRRKGSMQMPLDFTVTGADGSRKDYHVPNTWYVKPSEAEVLPRWYGWGRMYPAYEAKVSAPSGIRNVQIDTSRRLGDVNYMNNYKHRGLPVSPLAVRFLPDGGLYPATDRLRYRMYLRPDLWYNPVDGIKAGIRFEGSYLETLHKLRGTVWWNTHAAQADAYVSLSNEGYYDRYIPLNYSVEYSTPLHIRRPELRLFVASRMLDGLNRHEGGFDWDAGKRDRLRIYALTMWRALSFDLDYLLFRNEWSSMRGTPNASLNLVWDRGYHYRSGRGGLAFTLRAPAFTGNGSQAFNYSFVQLEAVNTHYAGRLELRTRFFGRYGAGRNIPYESALWLAGANPETMMDNKYTRSVGFVPDAWTQISPYETGHFQQGGGLNLRGYAGYFVADRRGSELLVGYRGRSGFAVNAELDFDRYIKLNPSFTRRWLSADLYAFADAGIIELSRYNSTEYWNSVPAGMWSDVRVDAGLGMALTVKKWWVVEKARPLTLRLDLPLFVNRPPYGNPEYWQFRYVLGISRSF